MTKQIVVGFDGSKQASDALAWAALEAERRRCGLHVIRSWTEPMVVPAMSSGIVVDLEGDQRWAAEDLDAAIARVLAAHPTVAITHSLIGGSPAPALLDASADASMVVVGARGKGGFARLLLGSVSHRVATHADSTVVVVRGGSESTGDVVVGVDGTEFGRAAVAWAAEAARLRGVGLHAVMAWSYLLPEGMAGPEAFRSSYTPAEADRTAAAIVNEVLGASPDVDVKVEAVCELASKALLERSEDAALLVVGPRRTRHRLESGSVTLQVLHHATCPVAVVRNESTGQAD